MFTIDLSQALLSFSGHAPAPLCPCCTQGPRNEHSTPGAEYRGTISALILLSRYPVCGSDGLTYGSGCQLRAASLRAQSRGEPAISQRSKGACEQGPSIVTPPKDIWNVTGAQIYLSCEVIGIPTPVLIWNKIIRGQYGVQRMELLPGDRENLAIQTRGGPEKHEVTGWVLISPLSKEDAGEYECHASNAKGEATASAKIHVVETLHEIALTKGW
uniref:Insulin like growth factor binding protein 7 n=1 Tax=Cyanoderma ruficeps TaxID=181631 RepID=A0A8C3RFD3_9PASS